MKKIMDWERYSWQVLLLIPGNLWRGARSWPKAKRRRGKISGSKNLQQKRQEEWEYLDQRRKNSIPPSLSRRGQAAGGCQQTSERRGTAAAGTRGRRLIRHWRANFLFCSRERLSCRGL